MYKKEEKDSMLMKQGHEELHDDLCHHPLSKMQMLLSAGFGPSSSKVFF